MTKKDKLRIEKLKKVINHHRYLYHVLDKQEISDEALDSLKKELFDLEQKYPEFITPDSPTQRVGGRPLKEFKKVKHFSPMLSINDAFTKEDVENWLQRNEKLLTPEEVSRIDFFCELKIDGLAIELIYENGILKTGSTRGNGLVGEDVTLNIKTIETIPLRLRPKKEIVKDLKSEGLKKPARLIEERGIPHLVVRGEVFISKKEFKKLNKEREKKGETHYANPRNVAAGSIRQLDPKITASRHLSFSAYDLLTSFSEDTHEQKHKILKILGFKIISENRYAKNLQEVFGFRERWLKGREKLTFEIDGTVIIVNSNKIFEKLGAVGKAPRGIVAYKFPLKQATTVIKDIEVQIGRTGALTPVAILKPVRVGGVTISRATLHNEDEIRRLGVKVGDTVIVGRAGDVIPDVLKVLPKLRTGKESKFSMPKICPICGTKIVKGAGEVLSFCPNPECKAKQKRYLYHLVSKRAFNIEGLGPKIIDQLIEEGLISDAADLFELKEGDLIPLERFAEKSAENLVEAIQASREIPLPQFIYAIGIRNVGEETSYDLAKYFGTLKDLKKASAQELEGISDIGPIVAKSIKNWFSQKRNLEFLEKLKTAGIKILEDRDRANRLLTRSFQGKTFVLTGALEDMTREQIKEMIRGLGGEVSGSVSEKTDFVLAGKNPGSKYEKAKELGIKILKEKEFLEMIK